MVFPNVRAGECFLLAEMKEQPLPLVPTDVHVQVQLAEQLWQLWTESVETVKQNEIFLLCVVKHFVKMTIKITNTGSS